MSKEPCSCCEPTADTRQSTTDPSDTVLDVTLPTTLQTALGRFLDGDPVPTLGDWARTVRRQTGGGPITLDDLCHTDAETPHWGDIGDERIHFRCFYDAVILAALADKPVDIRTESPTGAVIDARADGAGDLTVTPPDAVFSFGIDPDVGSPADDGRPSADSENDASPSVEDGYLAICPYVKAFPASSAYEDWAETHDAATVAFPLAGATDLADALVVEP